MGLYDCDECGKPRINTPSGSVCSNGCGKLHAKIPSAAMRINEAMLSGVPSSRSDRGAYAIDGYEGYFVPKRVYRGKVDNAVASGEIVAIDGGRLRVFEEK